MKHSICSAEPQIAFNYLGQWDARSQDEEHSLYRAMHSTIGQDHDPADRRQDRGPFEDAPVREVERHGASHDERRRAQADAGQHQAAQAERQGPGGELPVLNRMLRNSTH